MKDQPGEVNRIASLGLEREGKYLTFSLGDEEYGIGILKVKKIIGMMRINGLPLRPEREPDKKAGQGSGAGNRKKNAGLVPPFAGLCAGNPRDRSAPIAAPMEIRAQNHHQEAAPNQGAAQAPGSAAG